MIGFSLNTLLVLSRTDCLKIILFKGKKEMIPREGE